MSYILEALKKSENERRAGTLPELGGTASYVIEPARDWGWAGVALAALSLIAAGVGIGWWQPWRSETAIDVRSEPAPYAANGVQTSSGFSAPVARAETPAVASAAPEAPVKPAVQPPPANLAAATPAPARPAAPAAVAPRAQAAAPAAKPAVQAAKPAVQAAKPAAPDALPVAKMSAGVVGIDELPAPVRSALPSISVDGFAAAVDAQDRFAVVNDRIVREGEEVVPGLRLQHVGDEGVVMDFRGYRFRPKP